MTRSTGKTALEEAQICYITALSEPQIRKLLERGRLQLGLFEGKICEVQGQGVRYTVRKNERTKWKPTSSRLQDKLAKLRAQPGPQGTVEPLGVLTA